MAYTMIAERNNQKVRKERESALIVLANARMMQSEGWNVVILDGAGTDFDPRAFEASVAKTFSWYEVKPEPVVRESAAEPAYEQLEAEALVAAELEAEALESAGPGLHDIAEADFDQHELDDDDADLEAADPAELEEDELAEMEFAAEPAE